MAELLNSVETDEQKNMIYDRQIRLWGADAQKRIGDSKVLFLGFGAVNVELCKNLVLAGFSATVCDCGCVTQESLGHNFFVEDGDVGKNVASASAPGVRELNPFATVDAKCCGLSFASSAGAALELVGDHTIVVCERSTSDAGLDECLARVDDACRDIGAVFAYVSSGADGAVAFFDLGPAHSYVVESGTGETRKVSEPRYSEFCTYRAMTATPWAAVLAPKAKAPPAQFLLDRLDLLFSDAQTPTDDPPPKKARRDFVAFANAELEKRGLGGRLDDAALERHVVAKRAPLAPIAAILGGILGQEVVKAVSGKGEPTNNVFVFDAQSGAGTALRANPAAAKPKAAPAPPVEDAIEL